MLITNNLNRPAHIVPPHAPRLHKNRSSARTDQIDLGLHITEHMHIGWFVTGCRAGRFLGLDPEGRLPDAKTVWQYREALAQAGPA